MANPEKAFARTLKLEGRLSDHPDDPGGKTVYGITEAEFPGVPDRLLAMPDKEARAEATRLMREKYWDPLMLDLVEDDEAAAEVFDSAYNCGPGNAVIWVQKLCRADDMPIVVDARIGPRTISAFNALVREDKRRVLVVLNCLQGAYYVGLCIQANEQKAKRARTFFHGWINHRIQLQPS